MPLITGFIVENLCKYFFNKGLDKAIGLTEVEFSLRLTKIINDTLDSYSKMYPINDKDGKYGFYKSKSHFVRYNADYTSRSRTGVQRYERSYRRWDYSLGRDAGCIVFSRRVRRFADLWLDGCFELCAWLALYVRGVHGLDLLH